MNVDLELYKVFCEVTKHKNISKAADSLNISQPAITQSIKKLENYLGGVLFYRKNKGVELTEEGKNLYNYIKESVETINNAENIFSQYINLEKGKIRIGGWDTLIASYIMPVLIKFIEKYPNIEISTHTGGTEELLQQLSRGELDILICNFPNSVKKYNNVDVLSIKKPVYCFFATENFLKQNNIKNMNDIKENQLIVPKHSSVRGKIFEEYCKENKIDRIKPKYEIVTIGVMKNFVINNLGVGFTNKEDIKDLIEEDKVKVIEEVEDKSTIEGFMFLKKQLMNSCTVQLVKEIKKYYNI